MIFFDIDGTLLDDVHAIRCGLASLSHTHGHVIAPSDQDLPLVWQQLINLHYPRYLYSELTLDEQRRRRIRGLLRHEADLLADAEVDHIFAAYLKGYEAGWRCFDDAIPVLRALQPLGLGVITNGDRTQQTRKLAVTKLLPFFEVVVSSGEVGVAKPNRAIFVEACTRAGKDMATCIYVGDSWDTDVLGSQQAGLRPVWLRRSVTEGDPVPGIDVVGTLNELLILQGFNIP